MNFGSNWKLELEKIKVEISQVYEDKEMGRKIFNSATTQLLLYYTRFLKVVEVRIKDNSGQLGWVRQIVPTTVVMTEIKQHVSNQ